MTENTPSSGMGNRIDSRMSQSGRDRRFPFRLQEVMGAVLRMVDMYEKMFSGSYDDVC